MKKIISTLFTTLVFLSFLLLPVIIAFNAIMVNAHGTNDHSMNAHSMTSNECVLHCIEQVDYIAISEGLIQTYNYVVVTQFITLLKSFIFVLPLALLYILIQYSPPNLRTTIKNFNYCGLIGVIKLTT